MMMHIVTTGSRLRPEVPGRVANQRPGTKCLLALARLANFRKPRRSWGWMMLGALAWAEGCLGPRDDRFDAITSLPASEQPEAIRGLSLDERIDFYLYAHFRFHPPAEFVARRVALVAPEEMSAILPERLLDTKRSETQRSVLLLLGRDLLCQNPSLRNDSTFIAGLRAGLGLIDNHRAEAIETRRALEGDC